MSFKYGHVYIIIWVTKSFPWQSATSRACYQTEMYWISFLLTLARYNIAACTKEPQSVLTLFDTFYHLSLSLSFSSFLALLAVAIVIVSDAKQIFNYFFNLRYFLENNCSWCHQSISSQSNEIIGSSGAIFCCENCFLFWRRASFKRAKTCDFCKNIRNAVSYVDFNDGTTQLQFCSDKCLNQYKMQIFCRETQAQLELNPHLKDNKSESTGKL